MVALAEKSETNYRVFLVEAGYAYEGLAVQAVLSNIAAALMLGRKLVNEGAYDDILINEWTVDGWYRLVWGRSKTGEGKYSKFLIPKGK